MTEFTRCCRRFIREESGLEAVEYAILLGLMVVGILAAVTAIGIWVAGVYQAAQAGLTPT